MDKNEDKAEDNTNISSIDDSKDEPNDETDKKDESSTTDHEKGEADNDETKNDDDVHETDENNTDSTIEDKDGDHGEEPPSPLDLGKVSEEIDKYISDISSPKAGDDDDVSEPPEIPDCVEQFANLFEEKIMKFDSGENPVKWSQLDEEEALSFLDNVDRLSKLSTFLCKFSRQSTYAQSINRTGGILQRAMSYLEDEFRSIVEDNALDPDTSTETKPKSTSAEETDESASLPSESTEEKENSRLMGYPEEVVSSMNRLAKAILGGGHQWEVCQSYYIARRNALEHSLHKLGFEKHSVDDIIKMQWESLEKEIGAWIKTVKEFATVIFPSERKLTEAVFSDYSSTVEAIFGRLSRGVMIQLLNFSEGVTMSKRSAEKLFKFLDIYEILRDLVPSLLDSLFPSEYVNELKAEAMLTRGRLGDALICIFSELETSIRADTGKTPVPGGAVHPLTRYTLNYLKYACEYKDTLEQVFREHLKIERADSASIVDYNYANSAGGEVPQNDKPEKQSPFDVQLKKVMDLLDANLEAKSRLYKDPSLSAIFMMNNGRYILQKIKGSAEMNSLMGDPWYRKRSSDLRQYHKNYQQGTWMKLLQSLQTEGLVHRGKVVKPVLKERFKSFNAKFDEIHKTQSTWVVCDEQLQSELRVSISAVVIPAYRSFVARFSQTFYPGRQTEKYIKYQPEDIETLIEELFDGNSNQLGKKKP